MRKKATRKCKVCGNEFKPYNSLQKFCGHSCASVGGKITRIKKVSEKKEKEDRKYTRNRLELIKENIEKNKRLLCESCGGTAKKPPVYKEECHHIVYRSEKPGHKNMHDKINLIILCCECHSLAHKNKGWRNELVNQRELNKLFGDDILDK